MTIENLIQSIQDCDNGNVVFNLRRTRSFLYKNKWYPLRAIINYASHLEGGNSDLTTDQAIVRLVGLGFWTRIENIDYTNNFPVLCNENNIVNEIKKLINVLYNLSSD